MLKLKAHLLTTTAERASFITETLCTKQNIILPEFPLDIAAGRDLT
jgi:hypothetical protein